MAVITLTTDWGIRDYYVAALKGQLISLCSEAQIVDMSHTIEHFDILEASYILSNCYDKFPQGTIHFIGMRGSKQPDQPHGYLLVKCRGHYFIGYDSGTFYLALGDEEKEIYQLDVSPHQSIYMASEQLCNIISSLVKGAPANSLGTRTDELLKIYNAQPTSDHTSIRGSVIHVDQFYNVVSNITKDLFERVGGSRPFTVAVRGHDHQLKKYHRNYDENGEGELVIIFNEKGNLVLALNRARASRLFGLKRLDPIRIEFEEATSKDNLP
jgi:S-adenosylmethionine hydrolase